MAEQLPPKTTTYARGVWQPMSTAPHDGSAFDVWAKHWNPVRDTFEWRRFADCFFAHPRDSTFDAEKTDLRGVEQGWFATHWMPLPGAPNEREAVPLRRVWFKRNMAWAKASGEYTVTTDMRTISKPSDWKNWLEFVEVRDA